MNTGLRQDSRSREDMFLRRGSRPGRRYSGEGGCVGEGHVREVTGDWYFYGQFYEDVEVARLISKSLVEILRLNATLDIRKSSSQLVCLQV